jgi:hypothetical protein
MLNKNDELNKSEIVIITNKEYIFNNKRTNYRLYSLYN